MEEVDLRYLRVIYRDWCQDINDFIAAHVLKTFICIIDLDIAPDCIFIITEKFVPEISGYNCFSVTDICCYTSGNRGFISSPREEVGVYTQTAGVERIIIVKRDVEAFLGSVIQIYFFYGLVLMIDQFIAVHHTELAVASAIVHHGGILYIILLQQPVAADVEHYRRD